MKHGEYYAVKRLRLLEYLTREKNLFPEYQVPEPSNPKYTWWYYKNSEEFERIIEEYFTRKNKVN